MSLSLLDRHGCNPAADIVRDYAMSRCENMRQLQRDIIGAIIAARPNQAANSVTAGWPMSSDAPERGSAEW